MKLEKLQHIKMSGMILKDKAEKLNENNYEVKTTNNLIISDLVKESFNEDKVDELLSLMYEDLIDKSKEYNIDSVGIWITYDDHIFKNSIKLETLNDMTKYGAEDTIPIYEFCKLTIMDNNES